MYFEVNLDRNIWDVNPSLNKVGVFADLVKNEGKRRSSNIMWAIYLAHHPSSAVYKAFDTEEKRENEVNKTFATPEALVHFDLYRDVIEKFKEVCISPAQRVLAKWEEQLKEFDEFVDSISFKTNFKIKKEALLSKKELWDLYIKARDEYFQEESDAKLANRGGYIDSLTESMSPEEIEKYG